jgi:hypothetical protein
MSRYLLVIICLLYSVKTNAADSHRYLPEHSGLPQGGIILRYPDAAEPIANNMGHILTEHGWSVLLVPVIDDLLLEQPMNNVSEQIAFMTGKKGQHNLVILAIGDVWDETIPLARSQNDAEPDNPIRGVVLLDVPGEVPAPPELPLLDLISRKPEVSGYKERRENARKNGLSQQQGLTLTYSTRRLGPKEDRITRRIRGWLHHNVKGMELKDIRL